MQYFEHPSLMANVVIAKLTFPYRTANYIPYILVQLNRVIQDISYLTIMKFVTSP
jgi:hypothetical protein